MSGGSRFDTAATVLLLVLGIVVAQQVFNGTLGSWLRSKFLGSGAGSSPGGLFALFGPMPDTSPAGTSGADPSGSDTPEPKPNDGNPTDSGTPKDTSPPKEVAPPDAPPPELAPPIDVPPMLPLSLRSLATRKALA